MSYFSTSVQEGMPAESLKHWFLAYMHAPEPPKNTEKTPKYRKRGKKKNGCFPEAIFDIYLKN